MRLNLRPITRDNWRQIAILAVNEDQKFFVESNSYSLAQSGFEPEWISVGLYDADTAVGYAMHGADLENGQVWLDRFMIEGRHQGKGYSKRFLAMLLTDMSNRYACNRIYLSIHPENELARSLYTGMGFYASGEMDGAEEVMILDRKPSM